MSEAIPNLMLQIRAESNSARADAVQIGIEFGYRDQRQDDCLHGARVQRCTLYENEYDVTGREIHRAQKLTVLQKDLTAVSQAPPQCPERPYAWNQL